MRYYLMVVQHNFEKDAENRSVPTAYDTQFEAERAYHAQLGRDMANDTLDWGICMVVDNMANTILHKRWDREIVVVAE